MFSAVYRRPNGQHRADWIAYDTLGAAMLGPQSNPIVGDRIGHLVRVPYGPPTYNGPRVGRIDLAR